MVVTVKVNAAPTVAIAEAALVMAGPWPTMTVRVWVALGVTPLAAVTVRVFVPVAVGVPDSWAVPLPLSTKVSPAGRAPGSVIAGVGEPVVVTAMAPLLFRVK